MSTQTDVRTTAFPAIRAHLGKEREYYMTSMKFRDVVALFPITDNSEIPVEQRHQRKLNKARIAPISQYILTRPDSYIFSSLVASYPGAVKYKALGADGRLGLLTGDFTALLINDGQHRAGGIAKAVSENPLLADHEISVLMFRHENNEQAQQMFSDLNRYTKNTPAALNITFDHVDPQAEITRRVADQVSAFKGFVDKESGGSLSRKSPRLLSAVALHMATQDYLAPQLTANPDADASIEAQTSNAVEFWNEVARIMNGWVSVSKGLLNAPDLRMATLSTHSIVVRAIGHNGGKLRVLCAEQPDTCWKKKLGLLSDIDWRKTNPDWAKIGVVINGNVTSNRQARERMRAYIWEALGLTAKAEDFEPETMEALKKLRTRAGEAVATAIPTAATARARSVKATGARRRKGQVAA